MPNIPNKPFILVDGSSYMFRAYHALPPLTNSKGQPTGAIYGMINMLKKLLNEYNPQHIGVIFDCKEPTFRHELFPEYKANRSKMPDELATQIQPLHAIIKAMGFPLIAVPGVEADDVIGTLARQAKQLNMFTLIATGDKDMAQLVCEQVFLINSMSDTILDPDGVIDKFQVKPEQIVDYLSLIGDSVDNIPGIAKVGPKTAAKWLQEYNSLEELIANADKITGKIGENLRKELSNLNLYKQLTTINQNVELSLNPSQLILSESNYTDLEQLFSELEFKTWLKELKQLPVKHDYITIYTKEQFNQILRELSTCKYFAIDTETTSINYMLAELVGISLAYAPGKAIYVPLKHDYPNVPQQLAIDYVIEQLKPILNDPNILKIAHNLKYDMGVLAKYGATITNGFDTMVASYVFNSTSHRHDLDSIAFARLNHVNISYEDIAGRGAKQKPFSAIDIETASTYAAEDADITLRLYEFFWPKLQQLQGPLTIFKDIDMPLVPVLYTIESNGVLIDSDKLHEQSEQISKQLATIEKNAYSACGKQFNLNSPKQLQEILFVDLNLPVIEKTPKGQPSTAESVLQELSNDYELPKLVLEYRSLSKLKSTYTDKLPLQVNPNTHRVHTSFHQAVTSTGRLSSSDPNLQNIPIRTEEGRKIREAFIAGPGNLLLSADYSQIELRIMAHLSDDTGLISTFAKGEDVHRATASEVFGIEINDVTSDQRRHAKAINFGLIYGMSAFGLAKQLSISKSEADNYIQTYFARFPKVLEYMETTKEFAAKNGYVETMFGRRLYLPDINSKNMAKRKAAERAAINAPMQGAQSDIIKKSMLAIHEWIITNNLDLKMILQVHDELVFEVEHSLQTIAEETIKNIMQDAATLKVSLIVETGWGQNWGDAH